MNEELLQSLPQEYAALADRRQVMLEVADELADLHRATTRLGDALEAAGLPGSEWRSHDASLRLISRKLPDITVDRFITRLSEFAAGAGPDWLHGDADDLDRFHREAQAIYRAAALLSDILGHRSSVAAGSRREWAIERAFGAPRTMAALDGVVEILEDFRALQPFMAPLPRAEWRSGVADAPPGIEPADSAERQGQFGTQPLSAAQSHTKLRDFARATMGPRLRRDGPKDPVLALLDRAWSFLAPALRRKPVAIALALVVAFVLATGLALLALHGLRGGGIGAGSPSSGPSSHPTTVATAAPAEATAAPVAHPTATKTLTPQLALTCKFNDTQGSSATLSIKNVGSVSFSWQASASRSLTFAPSHGDLNVGQTTTAQVTPRRGWTTHTVTVTASSGARSASYNATCG